jgi:hypothetical protein
MKGALPASCVAALVFAASTFGAQPGRAESAASSKANECLAKPKGAPPRGSHWFYYRDRSTGKRCWFLGPETMRVRRSEPAARRASVSPPSPPPRERPLPRQAGVSAPETPPAVASTPNGAVAATQFSEFWPPSSAPSSAAKTIQTYRVAGQTTSVAQQPSTTIGTVRTDSAQTGHALAGVDADNGAANAATAHLAGVAPRAAAASSSQPAPGLGQLLIFFAASVAFVAIAFRTTLKLSSALLNRRRRRTRMRPAPTFVRPPAPVRPPFDYQTRSVRAPAWLRDRAITTHWDSIERPPRRPLTADDPPLQIDEAPPPRRRAVA